MPGPSTGTEGSGVTGERQASVRAGARGAAIVLAVVLCWSIFGGLVAAIDHQLVDAPGGVLPSFTTRATLVLLAHLLELAGMVLAIRWASDGASVPPGRPSIGMLLAILALVLVAAGGSVASVWFPKQTVEAIAANLPIDRLAEWAEQTTRLGVLSIPTHLRAQARGGGGCFQKPMHRAWPLLHWPVPRLAEACLTHIRCGATVSSSFALARR